MNNIANLKVKIFADGADIEGMIEMYNNSHIKGLTTNPTLMKKAGITNYKSFCKEVLGLVKDKPISFEVFSDDFDEMEQQALEISSWAENVYAKIPVMNTRGESAFRVINKLTSQKVKVNITAIMTTDQVARVADALHPSIPSYVSIFAGRISDTGRDPIPMMIEALAILRNIESSELIWASPRELLNIIQADDIGCHVITVTNDILGKLKLIGYDLDSYSLDTVKMFYKDALEAGYKI